MPIVNVESDNNRVVSIVVEHSAGLVCSSKLCHLIRKLVEEEIEH